MEAGPRRDRLSHCDFCKPDSSKTRSPQVGSGRRAEQPGFGSLPEPGEGWPATHLLRVGAEAAAAAAQAPCRVLAVHAAPVRVLPVRVPVGLVVVIETPCEARVVPPVVVVFPRPKGSREQRQKGGAGGILGMTRTVPQHLSPHQVLMAPRPSAPPRPDPENSSQSPPLSGAADSPARAQSLEHQEHARVVGGRASHGGTPSHERQEGTRLPGSRSEASPLPTAGVRHTRRLWSLLSHTAL